MIKYLFIIVIFLSLLPEKYSYKAYEPFLEQFNNGSLLLTFQSCNKNLYTSTEAGVNLIYLTNKCAVDTPKSSRKGNFI